MPVQRISITVDVEVGDTVKPIVREATQDVIPSFVGGFSFGGAIGIGIRSVLGTWTASRVVSLSEVSLDLALVPDRY